MQMRTMAGLAVLAGALGGAQGCAVPDTPLHGMVLDPPPEAPVVRIADAAGTIVDLDDERGKRSVALFFGYTHCPDVCPTTLADWARANAELGSAGRGVRFIFVSVDPERDTPQVVRDYVRQFDTTFVGLVPTRAQLDSLQASWTFAARHETTPEMKPGEYGVEHPAGTFVIDRAGRIREILPPNTSPADIASDLRRIR